MQENNKLKRANSIISTLCFIIVIVAVYLTFSHSSLANKISLWQANVMGDGKHFPVLTACLLMLPPLLILLGIKKTIQKKWSSNSN
jgi:hypothetical protein